MKKLLFVLVALAFLAPAAMADDFTHGISPEGCYYFSETHQIVFSKDASLIGEIGQCSTMGSSQWYVKQHGMPMPDSYYNRIRAMELLVGK